MPNDEAQFTNLHSHSRADLSRNHKVLDEMVALVERVSTEVSTERAAFTTSSAANGEQRDSATETFSSLETKPQINSGDSNADSERDSLASPAPRVLSPEHPNDREAREWRKKYPFGADLADNACRNLED